jgi:hypothetical protein
MLFLVGGHERPSHMGAKRIKSNHIPVSAYSTLCRDAKSDKEIGAIVVVVRVAKRDRNILLEIADFRYFLFGITGGLKGYRSSLR